MLCLLLSNALDEPVAGEHADDASAFFDEADNLADRAAADRRHIAELPVANRLEPNQVIEVRAASGKAVANRLNASLPTPENHLARRTGG